MKECLSFHLSLTKANFGPSATIASSSQGRHHWDKSSKSKQLKNKNIINYHSFPIILGINV